MRSAKRLLASAAAVLAGAALATASAQSAGASRASTQSYYGGSLCSRSTFLCTEVYDSQSVFGHYVGHDEPSVLFYSGQPGSGNQMTYSGVLPTEPAPSSVPGQHSYDFQLYAAFWYGMAMCDSQSYPETTHTCIPDSDLNITQPGSPYHAGTAFMELQFYPPGYVQQFNGFSCSATQWCVALNIDSLSLNAETGQQLNSSCQSTGPLSGVEYVNFAYLTQSGVPQGPPNPLQFDPVASGRPNANKDLFLNQGDHYTVTLHDTQHGLQTIVDDTTTGQSGSMTASAANGFGQIKFAPSPSTQCQLIPYDFHPMYSTSSTQTTVPWAAATYNIAFDTEVGHFDYCSKVDSMTGACTGNEGLGNNSEPADGDDFGCFPAGASTLVKISGCTYENIGYDGPSYLPDWPNGSRTNRPSPTIFTSPLTGPAYNMNYARVGFNTDLPDIESQLGTCNRTTGAGCSVIPPTDDNYPAAFYPYYTSGRALGGCSWAPGQDVSGYTQTDYGRNAQYGSLLKVTYIGQHGTTVRRYNDYQQNLSYNPCPAPLPPGAAAKR
jgi:hypothetical protein